MPEGNNLGVNQITATQDDKEVTSNEKTDRIQGALTDRLDVAAGGSGALDIDNNDTLYSMLVNFTGTLTGDRTVSMPDNEKLYLLQDSTTGDFAITVQPTGGAGFVLRRGGWHLARFDGAGGAALIGQQLQSNLNFRVDARRAAAQTITGSATLATTQLNLDTEAYDIGAMFAPTSTDITIPHGGAGLWLLNLQVEFDEDSAAGGGVAGAGDRRAVLSINGGLQTTRCDMIVPAAAGANDDQDTRLNLSCVTVLSDLDVLNLRVSHNNGGTVGVTGRVVALRLWS